MANNRYVPILKAKKGEFDGVAGLSNDARDRTAPLFEVAPIPWDFANEEPAKTLDGHLEPVGREIARCWGTDRVVFIDLLWISNDTTNAGLHPVESVFRDARTEGIQAVPVVGLQRGSTELHAVQNIVAEDDRGVCIRCDRDDMRNLASLDADLAALCSSLGVGPDEVDLLIDLKDYGANQAPAMEIVAGAALSALSDPAAWRSLTLAGGSFPVNLTGAQHERFVPRADWTTWREVAQIPDLARLPDLGDYAVQHPEPQEIDPRLMRMSANLRYTTTTDWLILKGRNVRDHGYEQFHDLCAELVARQEFRGREFSNGDELISDSAQRTGGPGNATTWRKIATNHHIETVVDQIANLP